MGLSHRCPDDPSTGAPWVFGGATGAPPSACRRSLVDEVTFENMKKALAFAQLAVEDEYMVHDLVGMGVIDTTE